MPSTTPRDLVNLLTNRTLRVRTGLWLLPQSLCGKEPSEAARLGIDAFDARSPILSTVAEGQRFLGLNAGRALQALNTISQLPSGTDCRLVYNFDLLLARIRHEERASLWTEIFQGLPYRPHALLIVMPSQALHILPDVDVLEVWRNEGRLTETISPNGV